MLFIYDMTDWQCRCGLLIDEAKDLEWSVMSRNDCTSEKRRISLDYVSQNERGSGV